ncbi:MAG: hypothetical protein GF393_10030, partial [Armatimonadia bacterium]|nr:hypothetical protein [Armatimonadia bacterium]
MNLKELRERLAELAKEILQLREVEADKWTSEHQEKWDRLNGDYDATQEQIARAERFADIERESEERSERSEEIRDRLAREPRSSDREDRTAEVTDEHRALALAGWARGQYGMGVTDEHAEAMRRVGINPSMREYPVVLPGQAQMGRILDEYRTTYYVSTVANYGGQTVPEGFVQNFERAL